MKFLLCLFIIGLGYGQLATTKKLSMGFNDIMEIIGGVFAGMGSDIHAADIQPCVVDTGSIGLNLEIAAEDYLQKTYTGKMEAMAHLGAAYKELPDFISKCVPASEEFAKAMEKMVLAFANPLSVIYHMGENLIVNGQDIFEDVSLAMGAWQFQMYYDFGFYCGQAGFKILYVPETSAEVTSEAVQLILKGISGAAKVPETRCLKVSESGPIFKSALNQDFTFSGTADSFRLLGEALGLAFIEAEQCSGYEYSDFFADELNALVNPNSLVQQHYKTVLNGVDLTLFIAAKVNYKNRDWENAGFYIGKVLMALKEANL